MLPPLLRTVRAALFPNNALAPPRPPPSEAETLAIRRACAAALAALVPPVARSVYFATTDLEKVIDDVELSLEEFGDAYVNRHLIVNLIELLVVRSFPELGARGGMPDG